MPFQDLDDLAGLHSITIYMLAVPVNGFWDVDCYIGLESMLESKCIHAGDCQDLPVWADTAYLRVSAAVQGHRRAPGLPQERRQGGTVHEGGGQADCQR